MISITADELKQVLQIVTLVEPLGAEAVSLVKAALAEHFGADQWDQLHAELLLDESILEGRIIPPTP